MTQHAFVVLGLLLSAAAAAQGPVSEARWNQVDLQAEATREVQNDTVHANLYVELTDANPAALAGQLNRVTAEALKTAAEFKTVQARSGSSTTFPVYDRNQKLTGWRGRADIRLESKDFPAAAQLIGKLQSSLQLAQVTFAVSPELRRKTENELIVDAVAAFRNRAEVAARALGGKSYRIRRVSLNTQGAFPQPRPYMGRVAAASAADAAPPPPLEGGTAVVTVGAAGTVEVE
ncbi:MAG: SIMPL domain-containing protein [Burkholderiales bacterium]|jgi:predicted secreted protein|nr:SIMPL domain-containing protein [Burkholderiales bacterium]